MSAVIIIPTIGKLCSYPAIMSALKQTYPTDIYLICDGKQFENKFKDILNKVQHHENIGRLHTMVLPQNVGSNGFYGHRVYAAFSHLVNQDYVLFLDEDNWFETNHVESLVRVIETYSLQWSYSLRTIHNNNGFLCEDNCESLGKWKAWTDDYHHVDTSAYCIKHDILIKIGHTWHGGWGQDRVFYKVLSDYTNKYHTSGLHTLNYRLAGNEGSVKPDFFNIGNQKMLEKYNGIYPWNI